MILSPVPLDGGATLNGSSSYEFLSWTTSGPATGVQSNWNILAASTVTWAGTGDMVNWNNNLNWNGISVSGGTVTAVNNGGPGFLAVSGLSVGSTAPQPGSNVFIQSATGATVTGPTTP